MTSKVVGTKQDPASRNRRESGAGGSRRKNSGWTQDDVELLIRMFHDGRSRDEIAQALGRPKNAVAIKASRLRLTSRQPLCEKPPVTLRKCLSCRSSFESEGIHNRICDGCKSSAAWIAGASAFQTIGGL